MSQLIEVVLKHGCRHYDTEVVIEGCIPPTNLQIPVEVEDGLFILNHYKYSGHSIINNRPYYKFMYQQGIYDRNEQN